MLSRAAILAAARVLGEAAASQPARVILLGSYARGEARPDTDVDFLVVEPQVPARHREVVRPREALPRFPVPVDVMAARAAQRAAWRDVEEVLLGNAVREGKVLVGSA